MNVKDMDLKTEGGLAQFHVWVKTITSEKIKQHTGHTHD